MGGVMHGSGGIDTCATGGNGAGDCISDACSTCSHSRRLLARRRRWRLLLALLQQSCELRTHVARARLYIMAAGIAHGRLS